MQCPTLELGLARHIQLSCGQPSISGPDGTVHEFGLAGQRRKESGVIVGK